MIKTIFNIDRKFFSTMQNMFYTKYYSFIALQPNFKLKITYDSTKQVERTLKSLLTTYLDLELKSEKVKCFGVADVLKTIEYNKKNVHVEFIKDKEEVYIAGITEDVDELLEQLNKRIKINKTENLTENLTITLSEFRICVLKKYKVTMENSIPNLKIRFEKINSNLFKVHFENVAQDKINELNEDVRNVINNLKKINFEYPKSIISELKKKETILFQAVESKGLICSFEYEEEDGYIVAYVETLSIKDQVKQLLDDFIAKEPRPSVLSASSDSKRVLDLKLFQHRIIIINGYDKLLKRKWPTLSLNFDRKSKKYEILDNDAKTVDEAEKLIKSFVSKIQTQRVGFNKESIEKLKAHELDFLKRLNDSKIFSVVEFDLSDSSLVFYATNEEIIIKCKNVCNEYLKELSNK